MNSLAPGVQAVLVVVAFCFATFVGIRRGWFQMAKDTTDLYKERIEALESRVTELERALEEERRENARLSGVVQGKDGAIVEMLGAISRSGLCVNAWECSNRVIPVKDGE